jgi:hypothetical protein
MNRFLIIAEIDEKDCKYSDTPEEIMESFWRCGGHQVTINNVPIKFSRPILIEGGTK